MPTHSLITDAVADSIYYDYQTKRYRYKASDEPGKPIRGVFLSRAEALKLQRTYLERVNAEFKELTPRIKAGEIGVYKDAADLLKKIHVSKAIIAAGGIDKLTASQLGSIGATLKQQYYAGKDSQTGKPYGLKYLFRDVASDVNYSAAKIAQRLDMYALSGEITFQSVRQSQEVLIGSTEMIRILGRTDHHCEDCLRYASAGWQPLGSLPLPKTSCRCRTRCLCTISYK